MFGLPAAAASVGNQSSPEKMPFSTLPGLILPGQRAMHGTRKPLRTPPLGGAEWRHAAIQPGEDFGPVVGGKDHDGVVGFADMVEVLEQWLAAGLVAAGVVSGTGNGGTASVGRRTVKVEPSPGALLAVISPPISRHSLRLITSPSPDPPNCRVVDASAWLNSWNKRPSCSSVMPMPVSETVKWTQC
jgi:hypothetical protein